MDSKDNFELFQTYILAAAKTKAGSWNLLSKILPVSNSQLYHLRYGRQAMGGEIMARLLEYVDGWDAINAQAKQIYNYEIRVRDYAKQDSPGEQSGKAGKQARSGSSIGQPDRALGSQDSSGPA